MLKEILKFLYNKIHNLQIITQYHINIIFSLFHYHIVMFTCIFHKQHSIRNAVLWLPRSITSLIRSEELLITET